MLNHKKISAFLLGIAVCSAVYAPVLSVSAENDAMNIGAADIGDSSDVPEYLELGADENSDAESEADPEAEWETEGDYKYSVSDNDVLCIEKYIGSDSDVIIPDELAGKPVEEIGERAFFESSVSTIYIPASVNYIADNPFMESRNLTEIKVAEDNEYYFAEDGVLFLKRAGKTVLLCYPHGKTDEKYTVPEDVTTIGTAAMYDTQIKELVLPADLSITNRHALSYNLLLEKIDMSGCNSLEEVGEMVFAGCDKLKEIIFPENLLSIGDGAFANCSSLAEINLPGKLRNIGQNAFAATALTQVIIPDSVEKIGYCAFGYDEELNPVDEFTLIGKSGSVAETYATDKDEFYDYENNFNFIDSSQAQLIDGSADLDIITGTEYMYAEKDGEIYIMSCLFSASTIEIPSEIDGKPVTCIYGAAFYQNEVKSVIIPEGVTKIGSIAFADCTSLENVTLPNSLVTIEDNAFSGCSSLQYVNIPVSCETIGEEAFYGCTSVSEFKVASGNTFFSAEDGVLYNADKTVLIDYPAGRNAKSFAAPETLKEILKSAFCGSSSLEKIDLSPVEKIGIYAFEDCDALKSVIFSDNLKDVEDFAFFNCENLHAVRIYNSIESIGNYAFGFHYDENGADGNTNVKNKDFTIFAELGSGGIMYGLQNNITCENNLSLYDEDGVASAETVNIFGVKLRRGPVIAVGGAIAAAIIAFIGIFTGKKLKKKKAAQAVNALGKDNK